ncbi:Hypothetical predicted protein [Cloeon dipterum]|uniref:DNA/RNA non-specific endonuclease domain-containing protein n=1 Tax=Cloeon dipterum TaxID=197152 RepID=A0A8S1E4H0_9INSE|nr:Hypothetical predicted protein [Cloeon dipterum]
MAKQNYQAQQKSVISFRWLGRLMCVSFFFTILTTLLQREYKSRQSCNWSLQELPEYQPLYVNPIAEKIWLPTSEDIVKIPHGGLVLFSCPGGSLKIKKGVQEITLSCFKGKQYKDTDGTLYHFDELQCSGDHKHTVNSLGKETCGINNKAELFAIGHVAGNHFYESYKSCFDCNTLDSIYVIHHLDHHVAWRQKKTEKPSKFIQDGNCYPQDLNIQKLYGVDRQKKNLKGKIKNAEEFCNVKATHYLSRDHLAPRGDFVYEAHQKLTYRFINVAPQWQKMNGAVWSALEESTRLLACDNKNDLLIITGTSGTARLPDCNGELTEVYLAPQKRLRAPEYFWKLVVDEKARLGIAFVALNIPFGENTPMGESVCEQIEWLKMPKKDINNKYPMSCYKVDATIASIFPEVPTEQIKNFRGILKRPNSKLDLLCIFSDLKKIFLTIILIIL